LRTSFGTSSPPHRKNPDLIEKTPPPLMPFRPPLRKIRNSFSLLDSNSFLLAPIWTPPFFQKKSFISQNFFPHPEFPFLPLPKQANRPLLSPFAFSNAWGKPPPSLLEILPFHKRNFPPLYPENGDGPLSLLGSFFSEFSPHPSGTVARSRTTHVFPPFFAYPRGLSLVSEFVRSLVLFVPFLGLLISFFFSLQTRQDASPSPFLMRSVKIRFFFLSQTQILRRFPLFFFQQKGEPTLF